MENGLLSKMKNKIIIHIGLQKTGTTYLQNIVFPQLREVTYIGRPYTQENLAFNTLQYADHSLYSELILKKEIEKIVNIANHNPILISDELFAGVTHYNFINRGMVAERLSKVFPKAEIVLFLRNQKDLIVSLHNQAIKTGMFDQPLNEYFLYVPGEGFSLEKWKAKNRKWDIENRFINHRRMLNVEHFRYSKILKLYTGLFKKVHVFLYEDFQNDPASCLNRLLSIVSPEDTFDFQLLLKKKINTRLDKNELQIKLWENKLFAIIPQSGYRNKLAKLFSKLRPVNLEKGEEHVMNILRQSFIFKDNYELNKKLQLGMEKYAASYFISN